jgi:hypothetical protein
MMTYAKAGRGGAGTPAGSAVETVTLVLTGAVAPIAGGTNTVPLIPETDGSGAKPPDVATLSVDVAVPGTIPTTGVVLTDPPQPANKTRPMNMAAARKPLCTYCSVLSLDIRR